MAEERPVFIDPGAYGGGGVPAAPQVADRSDVIRSMGGIAESLTKLGTIIYRQEQEKAVLDARLQMTRGFIDLEQNASAETDWKKIQTLFSAGGDQLRQKVLIGPDKVTTDQIQFEFERARLGSEARITANLLQKKTQEFVANTNTAADQIHQLASLSPDPNLLDQKQAMRDLADSLVGSGSFDQRTAAAWLRGHLRGLDNQKARQTVIQNAENGLVLLEARSDDGKEWTNFTDLDPLVRDFLKNTAVREIERGRSAGNTVLRLAVQDYVANLEINGPSKDPKPFDINPIDAALQSGQFTGDQISRWHVQESFAVDFHDARLKIEDLSPAGIDRLTESMRPMGGVEIPFRTVRWNRLNALAVAEKTQIEKDPGGSVSHMIPEGKDMAEGIRLSLEYQAQRGILPWKQRPLSKTQAEGIVTAWENMEKTQDKMQLMGGLLKQLHQSGYTSDVVNQLRDEGLPFFATTWATDLTWKQYFDLTQAHVLSESEWTKYIEDSSIRRSFRVDIDQRFDEAHGMSLPPTTHPDDTKGFRDTFLRLALYYAEKGRNDPMGDAEKTLFGNYIYSDTMRIPIAEAENRGRIEQMGVSELQKIRGMNLDTTLLISGEPIPQEAIRASVLSGGKWYISADESRYILWNDGQPVYDADLLKANMKAGLTGDPLLWASTVSFSLANAKVFDPSKKFGAELEATLEAAATPEGKATVIGKAMAARPSDWPTMSAKDREAWVLQHRKAVEEKQVEMLKRERVARKAAADKAKEARAPEAPAKKPKGSPTI